jgi:pimeloyl-ACP methyl ester carboxylesterase
MAGTAGGAQLAQRTRLPTWLTDSAQHVARRVACARVREMPDVGHFAPLVAPGPVAEEVVSFFATTVRQPA